MYTKYTKHKTNKPKGSETTLTQSCVNVSDLQNNVAHSMSMTSHTVQTTVILRDTLDTNTLKSVLTASSITQTPIKTVLLKGSVVSYFLQIINVVNKAQYIKYTLLWLHIAHYIVFQVKIKSFYKNTFLLCKRLQPKALSYHPTLFI